MKWSTIKFEVFEAKDFEDAYSKWLERNGEPSRKVSISEMDFELIDFVPSTPGTPEGMGFTIIVDGERVEDYELLSGDDPEKFFFLTGNASVGSIVGA